MSPPGLECSVRRSSNNKLLESWHCLMRPPQRGLPWPTHPSLPYPLYHLLKLAVTILLILCLPPLVNLRQAGSLFYTLLHPQVLEQCLGYCG